MHVWSSRSQISSLTLTLTIVHNLSSLTSMSVYVIVSYVVSFISSLTMKTGSNSVAVHVLTLHGTKVIFIFFTFILKRVTLTFLEAIIFTIISQTVIDFLRQLICSSQSSSPLVCSIIVLSDGRCSTSLENFIVGVLMHFCIHLIYSIVRNQRNSTFRFSLLSLCLYISHFW